MAKKETFRHMGHRVEIETLKDGFRITITGPYCNASNHFINYPGWDVYNSSIKCAKSRAGVK